jgi:hypothetical protein
VSSLLLLKLASEPLPHWIEKKKKVMSDSEEQANASSLYNMGDQVFLVRGANYVYPLLRLSSHCFFFSSLERKAWLFPKRFFHGLHCKIGKRRKKLNIALYIIKYPTQNRSHGLSRKWR